MPSLPKQKKKKILRSGGFKKWKAARKKSKYKPKAKSKDLLRAFQIDKSLEAKTKDPKFWKKVPHRSDLPGVDKGTKTWSRKKKYYSKRR